MLYNMGTIGDETVNSDSVNLGSNPSSPATTNPHETGTSDDFGLVERAAKSEQNGYAGCTEPGTADIPTEPKAFGLWVSFRAAEWPAELYALASRAHQSLVTRDQAAIGQSYAMRKAGIADWSAFTTAYAEHKAREAA
jgi:hypothetical protein